MAVEVAEAVELIGPVVATKLMVSELVRACEPVMDCEVVTGEAGPGEVMGAKMTKVTTAKVTQVTAA